MNEPDVIAATQQFNSELQAALISPPMPIQDVVDLAEFMVNLTIEFTKFSPGGNVVGGPVEIAAITKHEGFKWVKRKHYFPNSLNSGADNERKS